MEVSNNTRAALLVAARAVFQERTHPGVQGADMDEDIDAVAQDWIDNEDPIVEIMAVVVAHIEASAQGIVIDSLRNSDVLDAEAIDEVMGFSEPDL